MNLLLVNNKISYLLYKLFCLVFVLLWSSKVLSQEKFKVVLDAGHGGRDPGNLGNNYVEKDISLNIILEVGRLFELEKDIEVIYTRDDDTFIELDERGKIAQNANANLFISVHCDAFRKPEVHGISTFVLGLHENDRNFEIAKRENSVILMEDNYETRYEGFDPNSPESVIGLTLMQEEFLDQSLFMASLLQEHFVGDLGRLDRLVKQAGFLVLRNTFMPSVYVEAGFLTNKKEGAYLNSEKGQIEVARSIFEAVIEYKKQIDENTVADEIVEEEKIEAEKPPRIYKEIEFKVQIASSSKKVDLKAYNFKGIKGVTRSKIGGHYKYYYGSTSNYDEILALKKIAIGKGYPSSFVVAFNNDERVPLNELLSASQK